MAKPNSKRKAPVNEDSRVLRRRKERETLATARAKKFGGPQDTRSGGRSFLEESSVLPITRHDYLLRVTAFRAFCQTHGLQIETSTDLDQALVEWFDVLFFEGWGADCPSLGKWGRCCHGPSAH